jgi:putative peptide zinc metalloprotease protein
MGVDPGADGLDTNVVLVLDTVSQGSFFVQTWYRVARLRPRVVGHIKVERHRYGGQSWYALSDPLSGQVHRLTPSAYLFATRMDGVRTIDDIWQEMVAELDTKAPGQEAIVQLLMQLHGADLLAGDVPPDAAELLARRDRLSRALLMRNLRSPMSLQIPLIDPDRFLTRTMPFVRPLLGWFGLACWLVLVAAGLLTAGENWAELSENAVDRVMAGEGLFALALCYPVIKILHELGHGYAAKRFGCDVREMGVMLLVLFPVPYVDAGASAGLRSKWQRAMVGAAGIMVELALAAVAALVWASAEPGLLRAIAFNVMLIGGVSTVVVNGNPLLRFDGYYVLSDVLEVPNLAQRGTRYLGHLVNRYIFRVPGLRDFSGSGYERAVMLVHAPLSWLYRITVTLGVALFVAAHYFIAGIVMAVVTITISILWPMAKALWGVVAGAQYHGCRGRVAGLTFGALTLAAALVLAVPAPVHSTAEGVIWTPPDAFVRAGTDGFIRTVDAMSGATVPLGARLFTLEHPIAEAKLRVQEARVAELDAKYTAEWVTDRIAAEVTRFELEQEQATLARERVRIGQHSITAQIAGVFHAVRPLGDMQGRYVKLGEIVGYVTPTNSRVARVVVPQVDIGLIQDGLRNVQIRLADRHTEFESAVVRAVPAAVDTLPSPALTSTNGGVISTDPRDRAGLRTFERYFQLDLALPNTGDGTDVLASSGFGARVFVRFDYAWEPIGQVIYRHIRQGLLSRFET